MPPPPIPDLPIPSAHARPDHVPAPVPARAARPARRVSVRVDLRPHGAPKDLLQRLRDAGL